MIFHLDACCLFEAKNIDDAMRKLSNHFKKPSGLIDDGYIELRPMKFKFVNRQLTHNPKQGKPKS